MSAVARVMTELALDRVFDYAVPATLAPVLRPGHRVRVPFGGREVVGYVIELADRSELPDLKPIRACLDTEPLVTPTLLDLARWLAGYYLCPLETALRTVLPAAVRHEDASARWHRFIHITRPPTEDEARQLALRGGRRAALLEALKAAGPITVADAKRRLGATPALLKGLEGMELIRLDESEVPRDPFEGATFLPSEPLALNLSQAAALASVTAALHEPSPLPILLHGVTGSGKTEIYLQAIAASLDLGRGAIVLVPEIALTPQNVEHFKSRFARRGTGVAVLHSHLSGGERRDEWHRIRSGAAPVVIGARSAVFAPVSPLGLIVVDEEHESSYKQGEAPRYHARDVAVMRGHLERVPVVLGSATPSLESHYNACRGKYRLVSMPERIDGRAMPEVRVVDMRHEKPLVKGGPALISRRLHGAILDRLERGEQVILFLNRRGYSTSLICPACGQVATCPHCSVSLTFHRRHRKLKCHLCNHEEAPWDACPACHKDHIRHAGAGTERVELGLERLYPKARIARMDSDAMTRKGAHARLLSEFRAGRIDLLVGTQMIAKGLHFPNVTLVGVVNADLALHLPDFRAAERVFQLLTQVAGRAGRGEVPGEVFVQTHTPHHPAIQFARRHDFPGFYEHEIAFREQLGYPPVRRALLVGIRSRSNETAAFVAASLAKALKARLPASALVTGPAPAPIEKIQDHYRHQIFIRGVPARGLAALFRELRSTHEGETVSLTVDVDPLSLL